MKGKAPTAAHLDWRLPHHWIAFGLGSGLLYWAPGTAGTIAAIPLYLALRPLPAVWYLAVLSLFFLVGVWACEKTAQELRSPDPAVIVWDEVVGFLFGMTAAPPGWTWIVIGFVLFRVFDIVKPWPIREMDRRIGGGLGIMLDDLAAGAATWIALQAISRFLV